jgi:ABC-type microcin C transport system permease subunit YejE
MDFTNKIAAKLSVYKNVIVSSLKSKTDDESGDIVQTLIIIGISVVLGGLLLTGLSGLLGGCIDALSGKSGQCFGVSPK